MVMKGQVPRRSSAAPRTTCALRRADARAGGPQVKGVATSMKIAQSNMQMASTAAKVRPARRCAPAGLQAPHASCSGGRRTPVAPTRRGA
jgi:hypothetical protein